MTKSIKIHGTADRPRVSIFRSNIGIYAEVIDDQKGNTILESDSRKLTGKPVEKAFTTGKQLGEALKAKKITTIVFDRNSYRYHGQVQSLADGIRDAGITF